MAILTIENVHSYYGQSHVLHGVSLDVQEGKVSAVLGRNGVGKTTLVCSVMGLVQARQGKIVFRGQDITHLRPFQINRLGIGMVPQGRRIFKSLTTKENVDIASRGRETSRWPMEQILSMFPRLKERLGSRGNKLSGGEQQMLAIGRALAGNPNFLVMDEPTEGLAPVVVQELERVIAGLKNQGISILLVEQNLHFALGLADHVFVMSKGSIVYECSPDELLQNTEVRNTYLGV